MTLLRFDAFNAFASLDAFVPSRLSEAVEAKNNMPRHQKRPDKVGDLCCHHSCINHVATT
jgi:hypothetical protein